MQVSLKKWVASGSPWVWLNAGAVAISVVLVLGLLGVIASRGLVHFWPAKPPHTKAKAHVRQRTPRAVAPQCTTAPQRQAPAKGGLWIHSCAWKTNPKKLSKSDVSQIDALRVMTITSPGWPHSLYCQPNQAHWAFG